jgi:hypothetical protein
MNNLFVWLCWLRVFGVAILWIASHAPSLVRGAEDQPLQVFILAGQSNMQGHAQVRTFPHIGMDPATAPLLAEMQNPDGTPTVCDRVWISSIGSADQEQIGPLTAGFGAASGGPKIGPEFTFGLRMQKHIRGPILIIKTAWGGKSLNTDFRSPSAGPYVFHETQQFQFREQGKDMPTIQAEKDQATGHSYRLMIEHVRFVLADIKRVYPQYEPRHGYELAGFVWFQGWNDMVDSGTYPNRDQPGGYDAYRDAMVHFIRDVRQDLQAPKLPFVIGVLGVGGPVDEYGPDQQRYKATHQNFRLAMAAPAELPEFQGNVAAVLTEKYWDQELTKLRARENAIRQQVKKLVADGTIESSKEQAIVEQRCMEQLSERERQVLGTGISNAEFHYLGSAKILGQIGAAFAEALVELRR